MKKKTNPLIKKNPKMICGNVFGDDSSDEDTNNKKDKVNRHRNITQKSLKAQVIAFFLFRLFILKTLVLFLIKIIPLSIKSNI